MIRAWCLPTGYIGFGRDIPAGAIIIARGPEKPLREFIAGSAHHARGDVLLVPGVPGADNKIAAAGALERWRSWIATKAPADVRVLPS
jgi:hypothetical protein